MGVEITSRMRDIPEDLRLTPELSEVLKEAGFKEPYSDKQLDFGADVLGEIGTWIECYNQAELSEKVDQLKLALLGEADIASFVSSTEFSKSDGILNIPNDLELTPELKAVRLEAGFDISLKKEELQFGAKVLGVIGVWIENYSTDDLLEQADHLRKALRGEAAIARYLFASDNEGVLR